MKRTIAFSFAFLFWAFALPTQAAPPPVAVPFVGCASDGQVGPATAPQDKPKAVQIDPSIAARLAFYQSKNDGGVLAPRGWYCANVYGSDGWILFVSPHPIKPDDFFPPRAHPVAGPFIQVSMSDGGTSGRFAVAHLAARYFPELRGFVHGVISEGIEPVSAFPSGPYPKDRLVARKMGIVEYVTPAHSDGLGTAGRLKPDDEPILSAAMLLGNSSEPSALVASVRLPKGMTDLAPVIIHEAERRYAGTK